MTTQEYWNILQNCTFFSKFMYNICKFRQQPPIEVKEFLLTHSPEQWIDYFYWDKTPEGNDFWEEIYDTWFTYVDMDMPDITVDLKKWYDPKPKLEVSIY